MLSRLLTPASEISTHFHCDNCRIPIDKVSWIQCKICKAFDLCDICANIKYDDLLSQTLLNHQKLHPDPSDIDNNCMELVLVEEAETSSSQARIKRRQEEYERIIKQEKIENDYDMAVVMDQLEQTSFQLKLSTKEDVLESILFKYHYKANQQNIHVLSLDGATSRRSCHRIRGYMPIKILGELITQKYLPNIEKLHPNDLKHKELFQEAQLKFTKQFDYFVGTSTGGLIAFGLAINYNIMDMKEIYSDFSHYFKRNCLGPLIYSKYDPSIIHEKIDDINDSITFPGDKKISAKHATLLDIRNLLNPDNIIDEKTAKSIIVNHINFLEFINENNFTKTSDDNNEANYRYRVKREKVLLITTYNTTKNEIIVFNTSDSKHWGYLMADTLKATMAAPTYFPAHKIYKGEQENGCFKPGPTSELFIDGGVFANDPELAALSVVRMQWKKPANYHLLSIGTGLYMPTLSSSTCGGYFTWICNHGLLVNVLMNAVNMFIEKVGGNLAKSNDIRRMKLNYKITKVMDLDDPDFVHEFDQEWEYLKNEADYKALLYFYNKYIEKNLF